MYKIYNIKDRNLINFIVNQDPYNLLNANDFSKLILEVDNFEKKAFINTGELLVFVDYDKIKYLF